MIGGTPIGGAPIAARDAGIAAGSSGPTGPNPVVALFAGALAAVSSAVAVAACAPPEFNTRTNHALAYRPFKNGAIYGMTPAQLPAQQVHISAEPERRPDTTQGLHVFRSQQVTAAPTYQPLSRYTVTYRPEVAEVEIRRADHSQLHAFRAPVATVAGQPWLLWPKPSRFDPVAETLPPSTDYSLLFNRTTVAAPPAATYQPLLIQWKPAVAPVAYSEEWIYRGTDHAAAFTLFPRSFFVVGPVWAEQPDIQLEEYTVRTDHSLLLTMYRGVQVTPPESGGMTVASLPPTTVLLESLEVRQPDTSAWKLFFGREQIVTPAATYQPLMRHWRPPLPVVVQEELDIRTHHHDLQLFLITPTTPVLPDPSAFIPPFRRRRR